MNLISHNNYLLVKPLKEEEKKTAGGILLVEDTTATEEQIARGEVIIGSEKFPIKTIVYFNKVIPDDILIKENGEEKQCFALQEEDVMFSEYENNSI